MQTKSKNRSGFSLLEVLAAITVLTIASMSIVSALGNAHAVSDLTDSNERVLQAMDSLLEHIQSQSFQAALSYDNVNVEELLGEDILRGLDPIAEGTPIIAISVTRAEHRRLPIPDELDDMVIITLAANWLEGDLLMHQEISFYHYHRG